MEYYARTDTECIDGTVTYFTLEIGECYTGVSATLAINMQTFRIWDFMVKARNQEATYIWNHIPFNTETTFVGTNHSVKNNYSEIDEMGKLVENTQLANFANAVMKDYFSSVIVPTEDDYASIQRSIMELTRETLENYYNN